MSDFFYCNVGCINLSRLGSRALASVNRHFITLKFSWMSKPSPNRNSSFCTQVGLSLRLMRVQNAAAEPGNLSFSLLSDIDLNKINRGWR